jgi:hypothetical protein
MTKINKPTGFIPTPKAETQTDAPAVKKNLKAEAKKAAVRDGFEQKKVALKGREGSDQFVKGKGGLTNGGVVKFHADNPIQGGNTGGGLQNGGIVKFHADNPIQGGNTGGLQDGGIVKFHADNPIQGGNTGGINVPPDIVKIISDDPIHGGGLDTPGIQLPPDIVKIISDDPIQGGGNDPGFQIPPDIIKIVSDDPIHGGDLPSVKPLDTGSMRGPQKVMMDNPIDASKGDKGRIQNPDDGVIVKIISDDPLRGGDKTGLKPQTNTDVLVKVRMDSPV